MKRAARPKAQRAASRGFTLIEILVVVVIVGLSSAAVVLSLRDPASERLQREAERLATLLEVARLEARASGLEVRWLPREEADGSARPGFRFLGLPPALTPAQHWLTEQVRAEVLGATAVTLGPEAVIGPQRIALQLDGERRVVATAGLGPFEVLPDADGAAPR